uniref:Reverse transcriptase domain-containing protein n=1 Tax=Tanacetum cinerariifolium TaxID=118510 RepID=A0A6L2KG33_TANCI|nr:hypothetical protein [Tanacetum cinerariifolium]
MTSITSLCEMACQVAQKKLEEKQIEEERAAKAKYYKLLICYDDDEDYTSTITPDEPVLSTEEPDNSLNIDSFNGIYPYFDDNPLSGSTTYPSNSFLEEFTDELALITYPLDYDDN